MKKMVLAMVLGTVFVSVVPAQEQAKPPLNQRQQNQRQRIKDGAQSGALNQRETTRLGARSANIQQQIREDRRDGGGMTAGERRRITRRQNGLSRDIAREKHDRQQKPNQ